MNSRSLAAALIAAASGITVMALLVLSGVVLYQRLFVSSSALLLPIALVSAAIGAYMGWLVGLLIFSSLRGAETDELEPQ